MFPVPYPYPPEEAFLPGYAYDEPIYGGGYFPDGYFVDDYYGDDCYGDEYYGGEFYDMDYVPMPPPMLVGPPPPPPMMEAEEVYTVPALFDAKAKERAACKPIPCKKKVHPAYEPDKVNVKEWFGDKFVEPQPFLLKKRPPPVLSSPQKVYTKETKVTVDTKPKQWNDAVQEHTNIARITEWLYLCGAAAVTPANLKTYGITQIINVTNNIEPVNLPNIKSTWVKVESHQNANIAKFFDIVCEKIVDAKKCKGHVLIHCMNGRDRAPVMCIAYLMKCHRMSLSNAVAYIKDRRPGINPNPGFIAQLKNFEAMLYGGNVTTVTGTAPCR